MEEHIPYVDVSKEVPPESLCKKVSYIYECKEKNEDPRIIVKWCRKNFGERGVGWDFLLTSGNVTILIWNSRFRVMYELWKT